MRSAASLCAIRSASSTPSPSRTPSSTSRPRRIEATRRPSTVTEADATRCTTALMTGTVPWAAMAAVDVIADYIDALEGDTRRLAHTEWGVTLDGERAAGWPLELGIRLS